MAIEQKREVLPIEGFLNREFQPGTPNRPYAERVIETLTGFGFTYVAKVSGDGKCLIYALLEVLSQHHEKMGQIARKIIPTAPLFNSEIETIHHYLERISLADAIYSMLSKPEYIRLLQDEDDEMWVPYSFDQNAISYTALRLVMLLLNIKTISVFSLNPSKGDPGYAKDIIEPIVHFAQKDSKGKFLHDETLIPLQPAYLVCAQGNCHYSALLE